MGSEPYRSYRIADFNYELPDSAVAKYPLPERDSSKLLRWEKGEITDSNFSDLPGLLPQRSILVFNNTRVIRARLQFVKPTGAAIEVFCLEPTLPHDYVQSFAQTSSCRWKCIVGNKKRWKGEALILPVTISDRVVSLSALLLGEQDGSFEIGFSWDDPNFNFAQILEAAGNIPIPPYLHRSSEEIDLTVYQTVYARIKGSVAAPTAGLHFTERVFKDLVDRLITCEELTLHVGAGTFQPVKSDTIGDHVMHTEYFAVSLDLLKRLMDHQNAVLAVGTTSVRTLESLYWIGCKIIGNPQIAADKLDVTQWEPYGASVAEIEVSEVLQAIVTWMEVRKMSQLETTTQIMVVPGYQFRIIDGLITNFHQPQSTLLLLISAILGNDWKRVYAHALENSYRFLSYGDANLYWVREK